MKKLELHEKLRQELVELADRQERVKQRLELIITTVMLQAGCPVGSTFLGLDDNGLMIVEEPHDES